MKLEKLPFLAVEAQRTALERIRMLAHPILIADQEKEIPINKTRVAVNSAASACLCEIVVGFRSYGERMWWQPIAGHCMIVVIKS